MSSRRRNDETCQWLRAASLIGSRSAGRAGCSGSLHRKLVEGRAGNQRCKKKDRTQETLLALRAWTVSAGSGRLGVEACNMSCPPPGLLGEGAPALSGEGQPTECALRRGRYYRGLARRSGRPVLAACVHHDILCWRLQSSEKKGGMVGW